MDTAIAVTLALLALLGYVLELRTDYHRGQGPARTVPAARPRRGREDVAVVAMPAHTVVLLMLAAFVVGWLVAVLMLGD